VGDPVGADGRAAILGAADRLGTDELVLVYGLVVD
jgi:hypothetical protein